MGEYSLSANSSIPHIRYQADPAEVSKQVLASPEFIEHDGGGDKSYDGKDDHHPLNVLVISDKRSEKEICAERVHQEGNLICDGAELREQQNHSYCSINRPN